MICRTLCAALLALLLLALCPAALADSWKDAGNYDTSWYSEAETVFHISTPAQLAGLMTLIKEHNSFNGKTIYLDNNLDMSGRDWFCQTNWSFQGTFDGLGHAISGLTMSGSYEYMGLFGQLEGAKVQNLSIDASFATGAGGNWFGLLAAGAVGGTLIRNCTTSGIVTVTKPSNASFCYVGGLVGVANSLTVQACASSAHLTCDSSQAHDNSPDYMGGIIGYSGQYGATVKDCLFSGTIENRESKHKGVCISGMVGRVDASNMEKTTISNCLMLGLMRGRPGSGGKIYFYRIASTSNDYITNCYYVAKDGEGLQSTGGNSIGDNGATPKQLDAIKEPSFLTTLKATASTDVVWTAGKDGTPTPGIEFADYKKVENAIEQANALEPGSYTNFSGVEAAVNAVVRGKKINEQDKVDEMARAIEQAIQALILRADYTDLNAAVAGVPDDLSLYTEESRTPLQALIDGINWNLSVDEQDKVTAMVQLIKDAIAALVYRDADYSAVDAAIARAKALNLADYVDFGGVEEAINAAVRGKKINEQAAVDAMVQAILDAIAALVPNPPDLPKTGDTSHLPLWGALALGSLLALAALTRRRSTRV